jgi:hypothetical protein
VSRPKFSHIPLDKIKVDPRYQREIIPTHLDRIRNEFDEAQLDVLQLSKRSPDEYACIDGQHRLIVLAERAVSGEGGDTAPSLVHEGLTPQEEADLFRLIQERRRQLTPLDKYKSRLFADDPIAKGIEVIAEEFELEIGTGPKSIQGGFLDRLLDLGSFKRVRDGNGPYRFERVPPGKEQSRLIAQRKERSNGSGPRVGHSRAVPGTGKPKRRPGSRDVLPSAKR